MQVHGEAVGGHHAESGAGQHHHAGLHSFGAAGRRGLELGHISGEVEVVGAAVQAPVDQGCRGAVEGPGAVQEHGDAGETVPHGGRVGQAEGPDLVLLAGRAAPRRRPGRLYLRPRPGNQDVPCR